jgi:predicted phage terminase large subunit-like protein
MGGFRYAPSVGGTVTGRGGEIIIIDDPMKPEEANSKTHRQYVKNWFDRTLYTRLDNKLTGSIICVTQRLHHDDLAAYLIAKGGWEQLCLPAIAISDERVQVGDDEFVTRKAGQALEEVREPLEALERTRRMIGSTPFEAQYQQNPVPEGGNIIKDEWFQRYDIQPAREPGDRLIQSWDTAMKDGVSNDHSVCTTWLVKGGDFYLLDIQRRRVQYPELRRMAIDLYSQRRADAVLIEDKSSGISLIQDLRCETGINAIGRTPTLDKQTRMQVTSPIIEAGRVYLPQEAPWLGAFLSEVLAFPQSATDDQIDSLSQFLDWTKNQGVFEVDWGHDYDALGSLRIVP